MLRNLTLDGHYLGNDGIDVVAAGNVLIEDCVIINSAVGINDTRPDRSLFIRKSIISNNSDVGIISKGSSVVLEEVQSVGNSSGLNAVTGTVAISRSVFSHNRAGAGVNNNGAQVFIDNTEISHNHFGVNTIAPGITVLANSDIIFNAIGFGGPAQAQQSYGNNRIYGNTAAGVALNPIEKVSSDHGQQ